jgi:hypothetical protein
VSRKKISITQRMPNLQPLVEESDAPAVVAVRPEAAAVFGSHRVFERPVRSGCNQIDEDPKEKPHTESTESAELNSVDSVDSVDSV